MIGQLKKRDKITWKPVGSSLFHLENARTGQYESMIVRQWNEHLTMIKKTIDQDLKGIDFSQIHTNLQITILEILEILK